MEADIALIGLAVMGQNLVLNMDEHGFTVAVYNRTTSKVDLFLENEAKGTKIIGAHSLPELIALLKRPRKVMMLVKAGAPVDDFIEQLIPLLEPGDIIIDGGNSLFTDTIRRTQYVESKGLLYIGTGVSGGEEGARRGPSIMPGGSFAAWESIKPIFQAISAKVHDCGSDILSPCCDWVGENGAGHFVKMVHNGIEYGDMQLICEAYHLMSKGLGMSAEEIHSVFAEWNKGELNSYLIEITANILTYKDDDGLPLVDKILDVAGQKGTGKWTVQNSLDLGMPVSLIAEAVFARCISALKDERISASRKLKGPSPKIKCNRSKFIEDIKSALYVSKIISYAQGFMLMREAAREHSWNLNYGQIALLWRGGCIIRSVFLERIKDAFVRKPGLKSLLLDNFFRSAIKENQKGWRNVVSVAAKKGIPVPAFSTALAFYDSYRSLSLPINLLQAQRDYFGAHTYRRIDSDESQIFHTNWTGIGGNTVSTSYNA